MGEVRDDVLRLRLHGHWHVYAGAGRLHLVCGDDRRQAGRAEGRARARPAARESHRQGTLTESGTGGFTSSSPDSFSLTGVLCAYNEESHSIKEGGSIAPGDMKFIVDRVTLVAAGMAESDLSTDDTITIDSTAYEIIGWRKDPAVATYTFQLRGQA